MTNNTWRRLCNEWLVNECNDFAKEAAEANGISMSHISAMNAEKMQVVRKVCKANGVWLEDFCELDLYVELMPFGGYTKESLSVLKQALAKYRKSGRSNTVYKRLMKRR